MLREVLKSQASLPFTDASSLPQVRFSYWNRQIGRDSHISVSDPGFSLVSPIKFFNNMSFNKPPFRFGDDLIRSTIPELYIQSFYSRPIRFGLSINLYEFDVSSPGNMRG